MLSVSRYLSLPFAVVHFTFSSTSLQFSLYDTLIDFYVYRIVLLMNSLVNAVLFTIRPTMNGPDGLVSC